MSIRPSKDKVPPARRESTEISLDEINQLHRKRQPKPKWGGKLVLSLLLLGGLGGLGYWQWDAIRPHFNGMKAAIAATDFNFLSKDKSPSSADSSALNPSESDASGSDASGGITITRLPNSSETSDRNASGSDNSTATASTPTTQPQADTDSDAALNDEDEDEDVLLNHRRYEVAAAENLVTLNPNSIIRLQPEAQEAIQRMLTKAKIEGVQLGLVSGYRTLEDQNYLYFDLKAERGQSAQTRAEVSAPPGYSEHHTGYAVDFIDESKPDTHLSASFETTKAFKWLEKNAPYFSFEMSFPKDNEANVGYEPWHWRYVGNQESLELFYK